MIRPIRRPVYCDTLVELATVPTLRENTHVYCQETGSWYIRVNGQWTISNEMRPKWDAILDVPGGLGGAPDWGDIGGTLADQTDLQTALNGKSSTSHDHTGVYAPTAHSHVISDTTGLQTALDGKAATSHSHNASDITAGTVATARLGSGTADGTTFLRGDSTWATPAGGSSDIDIGTTDVLNGTNGRVLFQAGGKVQQSANLTFGVALEVSADVLVTGNVEVSDEAYGAGWNGSVEVPTKNALYDKIETISGGSGLSQAQVLARSVIKC